MAVEMNRSGTVDYDRFVSLERLDLCHFMDAVLADPTTRVSKDVLERMLSELSDYDEYHLLYALELGAKYSPETFARHLPQYLADEHASVVCSAYNALDRLPNEYVTQDLIDSASRALASVYPERESFAGILERLESRLKQRDGN
jgi:hypothetical protein